VPDRPDLEAPTTSEMIEEVVDLSVGLGVMLLPALILAVPCAVLLIPLALPVIPLALLASPYLLYRGVRRLARSG
jgi:hypothetical protein